MSRLRLKLALAIVFCLAVGSLGVWLLVKSQAATPTANFEVEAGTASGTASVVSDSAASGGSALQFTSSGSTGVVPVGVPGNWTLKFDDEFDGTSIDTAKWNLNEGKTQNAVTNHAANVSVAGGNAILTLASSSSGAFISSGIVDGWGSNHYLLPIGGYAEARVYFPGSGTQIYNWPAWWTVGNGWPAGGENDIAEGLGTMSVNYHSPSSNLGFRIPGTWSNAYHVYGEYRKATSVDIYYDGVKVQTYNTADNGIGHGLLVNVGNGYGPAVYGADSQVKVDYVRAWQ